MKKIIYLFIVVLLVFGCSSHGNLKIINKTHHLLYFSIGDIENIIDPMQSYEISLSTGKKYLFNTPEKSYDLYLEGETFLIKDGSNFVTHTTIKPQANKTLKIYANSNRACLKIKNNSEASIYDIAYQKIYGDSLTAPVILEDEIAKNQSWFKQIPYSSETDSFDVRFSYSYNHTDTLYTKSLNLGLDQLFFLELN